MNNRLRAILYVLKEAVAKRLINHKNPPAIYAMEQMTPLFSCLKQQFEQVIGSEYLDENTEKTLITQGIRHENVEQLSFADQSFDIII